MKSSSHTIGRRPLLHLFLSRSIHTHTSSLFSKQSFLNFLSSLPSSVPQYFTGHSSSHSPMCHDKTPDFHRNSTSVVLRDSYLKILLITLVVWQSLSKLKLSGPLNWDQTIKDSLYVVYLTNWLKLRERFTWFLSNLP